MDAKLLSQAEQMARELATQVSTVAELNGLFRGLMKSALQAPVKHVHRRFTVAKLASRGYSSDSACVSVSPDR